MKPEIGRRAFVGTVVAGAPLFAGVAASSFAQSGAHVHTPVRKAADPVSDHLVRELASIHNVARARGLRGEQARAFASTVRTLKVYSGQLDIDGKVRQAIAGRVAAVGRDALLYEEPNRAAVLDELKRYGFNLDERVLRPLGNPDYAARSAVLDATLARGLSDSWDRVSIALELGARAFDRRAGQIALIGRAQDPAYWQGYCTQLMADINSLQLQAAWICGATAVPYWGAIFGPSCAALWGAIAVLSTAYFLNCS